VTHSETHFLQILNSMSMFKRKRQSESYVSSLPDDRAMDVEEQGFKYTPQEPLPPDMEFEDDDIEEVDYADINAAATATARQSEDVDMDGVDEDELKQQAEDRKKAWLPGMGDLQDGEILDYDPRAYKVYHKLNVEWPSLSFDIYRDGLGEFRSKYPMTATIVAGTQAPVALKNKICVYKVSQMCKTKYDDDEDEEDSEEDVAERSDEDEDDDEDDDLDPVVEERAVKHDGAINRIRCVPQASNIVATWAETGKVHVWDLKSVIEGLSPNDPKPSSNGSTKCSTPEVMKPLFTFKGHSTEGFAMDWSPVHGGRMVTGDCNRYMYLWEPNTDSGSWTVDKQPFVGHKASVEDIQWSPTQAEVFASCSADRSIRVWDCRVKKNDVMRVEEAHSSDVNVVSWNRSASAAHLLVSGSDDGSFKVWDLRVLKSAQPAGHFKWHKQAITSIEWHPTQESVIGVASEDDSISIWDLGLEADPEALKNTTTGKKFDANNLEDIPSQLSFVHQGMNQVKELHFHPQIPSLIFGTTGEGFDVFKPDNL
jgi:ribosome assembly protein RRB1